MKWSLEKSIKLKRTAKGNFRRGPRNFPNYERVFTVCKSKNITPSNLREMLHYFFKTEIRTKRQIT
jgi:hypothetical protein